MKLNPSELRIGNYVSIEGSIELVEDIFEKGINQEIQGDYYGGWTTDYLGYFDDHYRNIILGALLTDDWLEGFGFVKPDSNDRFGGVLSPPFDSGYRIRVLKDENGDFYYSGPSIIYLRFVHQLQNIYFGLTGKELKLNEEYFVIRK